MAFLLHHGAVTLTDDNEYVCALGCGDTGPGGGPNVWFTAQGLVHATVDNVTQSGTYSYRIPGDYLIVAGYDRTSGGIFTVRTDRELIAVPAPHTNVGNELRMGLGAGSVTGARKTAGFQVGLFAVFVDEAAEVLIAMGRRVHRRMGW